MAEKKFGNLIVQLIPGGGWLVKRSDGVTPVVAWALHQDGSVRPLDTDSHGTVLEIEEEGTYLYHPDDQP